MRESEKKKRYLGIGTGAFFACATTTYRSSWHEVSPVPMHDRLYLAHPNSAASPAPSVITSSVFFYLFSGVSKKLEFFKTFLEWILFNREGNFKDTRCVFSVIFVRKHTCNFEKKKKLMLFRSFLFIVLTLLTG